MEQELGKSQAPQLEAVMRKREQIFSFSSFGQSPSSPATEEAIVQSLIEQPEIGGSEDWLI